MKRFLITSALILCLPAMAAEKAKTPAITATPLPEGAVPNPVKPTMTGPLISPEQSAKMSPEEAAKHAIRIEHPLAGPIGKPFDAPLGPGQTLAPGQRDIKPVLAPASPPLPHGPPVGMITASAGSIPKGWVDCEKTHAAEQCKALAASQDLNGKLMVKLPDSGKIEDLDKFLDAAAASKAEMKP